MENANFEIYVRELTLSDDSLVHNIVLKDSTEVLEFHAQSEEDAIAFVKGIDKLITDHTVDTLEES